MRISLLLVALLIAGCRTAVQGRGYVTDTLLFTAVEGDGQGGASTILTLYDTAARERHVICEIGATGESTFAVNRTRSLVAFNWVGGIYVVSFAGEVPRDCDGWDRSVRRVVACEACYEVEWRNARQLQYHEHDGKTWHTRIIDVD